MAWLPTHDPAWADRIKHAGVPIDSWYTDLDDYGFAFLGARIVEALSESRLSDDDVYPLVVQFWSGHLPLVAWPPQAPQLARRCAVALAARASCDLTEFIWAPDDASLNAAREAIIGELRLTPAELLSVLADHWKQLAHLEMPIDTECTLLAFAQEVLLEPVVGACAYMWSTLEAATSHAVDPAILIGWAGWSPGAADEWSSVVASELARLGRPEQQIPDDIDDAAMLLASARAGALRTNNDVAAVASSIVRTSEWPGETCLIDGLAREAVELARRRLDDIDAATDNDDIVDALQHELKPSLETLVDWIRDPSFGTLVDHVGSSTGIEMLHAAANWLTWSVARDALDVFIAMRRANPVGR